MVRQFYALLTHAGEKAVATAALTGVPVGFAYMAVGDGGGYLPLPDADQNALVNEVYRAPLNRLIIADHRQNIIRAEIVIPAQKGGFWIREAALFDDSGLCLAVANLPESFKPELSSGAGRQQAVNIWIAVSNAADVNLIADPAVIMASVSEVEKAKSEVKDYVDEMGAQLQHMVKSEISQARRDMWEEDNPVGTTRFFNQWLNPNEKWPWSEWIYTGENKTIRIGKADGSDVGQTGGSDTVTLTRQHLPAAPITVTGVATDVDLGTKETLPAGEHVHGGVPERNNEWELGGGVRVLFDPNAAGSTDSAGEHIHQIALGSHSHIVQGETENLGQGKSLSVTEAHTLLMCWSRVA
ncbi:phage tail protein [Entomohabitans teleogrylli]|uniref:phage tail protein n=1 Tax=Entomohabitans teleogrylli TaxID=1384589 RepID=UPI00073D7FC0|nr:phage tail protein [Entomohabitans teleogrylli]